MGTGYWMKRLIMVAVAACALSACGPAGGQTPSAAQRAVEKADAAATADAAALDAAVAAQESADIPRDSIAYRLTQSERDAMSAEAKADLAAYEARRLAREYGGEDDAEIEVAESRYVPDPVSDWFVMNPYDLFCESLTERTGFTTPDQWIGNVIRLGGAVTRMQMQDDVVQVIDRDRPNPRTTVVFIRGIDACQATLERARERM